MTEVRIGLSLLSETVTGVTDDCSRLDKEVSKSKKRLILRKHVCYRKGGGVSFHFLESSL